MVIETLPACITDRVPRAIVRKLKSGRRKNTVIKYDTWASIDSGGAAAARSSGGPSHTDEYCLHNAITV